MEYIHLSKTTPIAKKPYRCIWCAENINIGEKHIKEVGMYDGFQSERWHLECANASQKLFELDHECEFEPYNYVRGTCNER